MFNTPQPISQFKISEILEPPAIRALILKYGDWSRFQGKNGLYISVVVVVVGLYSIDSWSHSSHSGWLDQFKSSYNEKQDGVHHGISEYPGSLMIIFTSVLFSKLAILHQKSLSYVFCLDQSIFWAKFVWEPPRMMPPINVYFHYSQVGKVKYCRRPKINKKLLREEERLMKKMEEMKQNMLWKYSKKIKRRWCFRENV